jgi:outer membrane receptor protein involved in Fe transport
MKRSRFSTLTCIATAWLAGAAVNEARAGSSDAPASGQGSLEEVIVTAEKLGAESVDKVPISIAVFNQAEMERKNIVSMADIAKVAPSVDYQNTGLNTNQNNSSVAIRGIYSNAGYSTTAIYIDDVPIQVRFTVANEWNTIPQVFDLDRVEVLRGPQGTLFGAGAEGGAIRFITPQPSLTKFSSYARAGAAMTDNGGPSYEAGFAFGGPLVDDKIGFRVSAWHRRDGGYIDHDSAVPGGYQYSKANWGDSDVVHAALTFAPTASLTFTPSIYYQHLFLNDEPVFAPANCPAAPCDFYTSQYGNLPLQYSNVAHGHFVNPDQLQQPGSDQFYIPALNVELGLPSVTLTSVTSYMDRRTNAPTDWTTTLAGLTGSPWPQTAATPTQFATTLEQQVFTQELRAASADPKQRLRWTVGVFYTRSKESTVLQAPSPGLTSLFGSPLLPGNLIFLAIEPGTIDKQLAVFGQLEYQVLSRVSLTAGVRASRESTNYLLDTNGPLAGGVETIVGGELSQDIVDPKFGINVQLDDNNLLYLSAAKGDRIGGINSPVGSGLVACTAALAALGYPNGAPSTYKSDSLWSYELGSKSRLLNGHLELLASAFHIDWSNIQQNVLPPACGASFTSNLGKATSNGADLVVNALLADSLKLGLSLGYTDARNKSTIASGNLLSVRSGDQINPFSAPWTIVPSLDYSFHIADHYQGYVRLDDEYHSKNPGSFGVQDPNNASFQPWFIANPSTNELNVHVGTAWDGWDLAIYALNALNSHPVLFDTQNSPVGPPASANTIRPLTIGISANYRR